MSADTGTIQTAAIRELCKPLRLPTVATQAVRLAEQAGKEKQSHLRFLEALLSAVHAPEDKTAMDLSSGEGDMQEGRDNLEGKALFRFFSTDGSARFWEVWKWPFAVRYSRILTLVK